MLSLRPANALDIPPIVLLVEQYKDQILSDYDTYSREFIITLIERGELIAIDAFGYAVGVIWFYDRLDDLHCKISLLIRPEYLKQALREDTFSKVLELAFKQVGKVEAEPMASQKGAIKLLRKHHFLKLCDRHKHTRKNGVKTDMQLWECKRSRYNKKRSKA